MNTASAKMRKSFLWRFFVRSTVSKWQLFYIARDDRPAKAPATRESNSILSILTCPCTLSRIQAPRSRHAVDAAIIAHDHSIYKRQTRTTRCYDTKLSREITAYSAILRFDGGGGRMDTPAPPLCGYS